MARFLTYTSPARGHLFPIVGTLLELRGRGHEVFVRTLATEVPRMEALGFQAAAIAPAIERIENDDWKARTPTGANKRLLQRLADRAEHELADVDGAVDAASPDVVLVDTAAGGAIAVADAVEGLIPAARAAARA